MNLAQIDWIAEDMAQDLTEAARNVGVPAFDRGGALPPPMGSELFAALDLGTNSCRMLIAAPEGGQFRVIDAFAKCVRLGSGLEHTGYLSRGAIGRTLSALGICAEKLRRHQVGNMRLVATEACRRARNGKHFLSTVTRETGLRLEVIRPDEEARLAVISCAPLVAPTSEQVLVFDIGGGSTELVWIDLSEVAPGNRAQAIVDLQMQGETRSGARIVDFISVPLGVATLHEHYADVADDGARFALMAWLFEEQISGFKPYCEDLAGNTAGPKFQMIGTSGTVTTVGAAHLGLRRYDRRKVDGMHLSSRAIDEVIARFLRLGPDGRRNDVGLGRNRAELIMSGVAILQTLLRIWPTESMRVADRGLREGMLFSMMSAKGAFANGVKLE